jgi:hypothetical protein
MLNVLDEDILDNSQRRTIRLVRVQRPHAVSLALLLLLVCLAAAGCWGQEPSNPQPSSTTRQAPPILPSRPARSPTTRLVPPPLPAAQKVVGLCLHADPATAQRGPTDGKFLTCAHTSVAGLRFRGRVVGYTPLMMDNEGGPRFGPFCPAATDDVVRAHLPQGGEGLLCLDAKPGDGNVGEKLSGSGKTSVS